MFSLPCCARARNSPPSTLNFAWCRRGFRYVLVEEPVIVTFIIVVIISIFGFITLHGLSKEVSPIVSNQTGLDGFAMKIMVQVSPYLILAPAVVFAFALLLMAKRSIQSKLKLFRS